MSDTRSTTIGMLRLGAASSTMFTARAGSMAARRFVDPAPGPVSMLAAYLDPIHALAAHAEAPLPLFSIASELFQTALADGPRAPRHCLRDRPPRRRATQERNALMISLDRSLPVNPPGTTSLVSRADVWRGLVLKAENALAFVPSMTLCKVIDRQSPTTFVREVEFRGDRMKERVTLDPERQVTFERLEGPVMGTIRNFIDEDAEGQLSLRFSFELEVTGLAAGSAAEKDYAATMEKAYLGAVDATLAAIRKLHDASIGGAAAPAWLTQYYVDLDAQKMDAFLAHHTADARVVFGNNPPAVGHEAIQGAIGGFWRAIDGLRHRFVNVWQHGATTVLECAVTYFRKDGKTVTVPCVSLLETRDGKVSELRVFIDLAPVFA